ncbi:MAG: peptidoglycan-binding protein, partial [Clostridia bacterium]|nr:peptidoglycan-binding protein [Clostridia bacterium]
LEKGDKGDAVKRLTTRLAELGYPIKPTSTFDSDVKRAVMLFQEANGLDADGEAGRSTQAKLFSVSAIRYGEQRYPTLVRGDRDLSLIYNLQRRLKDLGYYTIKVDGIFGSGTQRAVRDFQKVNGLAVTGKADDATQRLLYSSAAKPAYGVVDGSYRTLRRSSKYQSAVVPLQRRLKALGYYSGSIDGYFGSQTYRAVRNFQKRNGIDKTGEADPYTQQILYSSAARPASGSSSSSSSSSSDSSGYRLLYWGCEGSAVKRLQNALISAGYKKYVRSADGIYGQWTYDAVCAYQKDHGLSVDGIAGKKTQNSLYGTDY